MKIKFDKIIFVFIILVLVSCVESNSKNATNKKSATEFAKQVNTTKNILILDVRTPNEYNSGYINGAVNIDWNANNFVELVSKLDKSKTILIYCQSGRRSEAAAKKLREIGFTTVWELDGGILSWKDANLPLKK